MHQNLQNTIKPQAVIYCRVSTKQQVDEGNSLSTQERLCREYALKQGYEVVAVYIEKGESAKTKDRTELQKMMAFCATKKNNVSYVVVYKLDRFSRNTDDYSYLRIILKRYGIYIKSTTEYFENTPAGRFMENIISNVSQFDNDVRTERAVNGSRDAMREGRYVWRAPLGYSNVKAGGKGTIAPNEKAAIIRQTFEEVAKNEYPVEQIRGKMFHVGLVNEKGVAIARAHFYRLLRNPIYAGWIVKFGERHKGLFQPIVPEELFEQVQLVMRHRTRKNYTYQTKHPQFPLRRFISHPGGSKLTGSWNQGKRNKYAYYRYLGKPMNFPKDTLEAHFMAFMDSYSIKEDQFEALKTLLRKELPRGISYRAKDQEKIKMQVKELKEKQTLLIDKNMKAVISNEILREQLDRIDKQLIELNSKLYTEPSYEKANYEELLETAKELLIHPSHVWEKANNDNKLRLQVFEFPLGVTFDGEIFQTPEICRLFKVKDAFLHDKSPNVRVRKKVIKNPPDLANLPSMSGDNSSPLNTEYPTTEKDLREITELLIEAGEIVKNKAIINNNSP